ncbi:hypothetical protein DFH09DRAFT_1132514 [Mycena vulgaris]|nr:hypothetical protein DFH09DRAFT_1132514 [Mycena vulgaris]
MLVAGGGAGVTGVASVLLLPVGVNLSFPLLCVSSWTVAPKPARVRLRGETRLRCLCSPFRFLFYVFRSFAAYILIRTHTTRTPISVLSIARFAFSSSIIRTFPSVYICTLHSPQIHTLSAQSPHNALPTHRTAHTYLFPHNARKT